MMTSNFTLLVLCVWYGICLGVLVKIRRERRRP
jgi:hypothetical protein